ncbi:hypothetical protein [Sunxiuqinia dokdonensis]|uniref:Cytochrome c domain-containing protein n=1 Tax=Sunxiuqinia dokdonensis TaxID=1409788 RepID=A0A0L8V579_9BACT|nr:hypothetical protein [Sunxiuqinia dokdonensis]KOH43357.1 hypothetical protein NC99_37840 [Sunxiuqinia dokdonensis]
MRKTSYLLVIAAIMLLYGCNNEADEVLPEEDPIQEEEDCTPQFPDMDVTYNNYVKGIMDQYCISCHHAGNSTGPGDFSNYNGLLTYAEGSSFYARVIQDGADMPQGMAPLPKAIRDSLDVWIQNCAPLN